MTAFVFTALVNAQTVIRTNGGTETATGTDVSTVQKADGYASGDVITISGTSATSLAPFTASVRVEGAYTVDNFTVQSGTSDKQYIGGLANSRNYVLKLGNRNYNLTFKNVEFQNTDVAQNTAGIFLIMDQATSTVTLNLDNASFTKFKGSGDSNYGGVINSSGDLTINGTNTVSFYGNATGSGGAIFANKALTIDCDEMIFDSNACNNSGAIRNGGALDISGSKVTFTNNSARNNGGSIYSTSTVKIAGKGDNGVLTFTGNTAANEGGVIYSTYGIELDSNEILFRDNEAKNYGGALRFNSSSGKILVKGETVTFDNNTALNNNGGAIHTNANVEMQGKSENSVFTFSNNSAPNGNSGVIVAVGTVDFSTGSFIFQNNSAKGIAGAIEARKGISFTGDNTSATFTGNSAGESGSDIYLSGDSTLLFQGRGTYSFDGGIFLVNLAAKTDIDGAHVTIAGRENDTTNNYQLRNVTISNGGTLTVNIDYIDSLTGTFDVLGTGDTAGTLEFNYGLAEPKSLTFSESFQIADTSTGNVVKSGVGTIEVTDENALAVKTIVSEGTLRLSGAGTLGTGEIEVGEDGTLEFKDSTATIPSAISGTGDILVSAGTATLTGAVAQTGGSTTLANGTTLNVGSVTLNNLAVTDGAAATLVASGNLTLNNDEDTQFTGSITAPAIEKTGDGTLKLNSGESGLIDVPNLTVSGGRLDLLGNAKGGITVGDGSVFSPGIGIGEATVDGAFTLAAGGRLLMEIGGLDPDQNDSLVIEGDLNLDGGLIYLELADGSTLNPGDTFTVTLDADNSEDFVNTLLDYVSGAQFTDLAYTKIGDMYALTGTLGGGGGGASVPEPSAWVLLLLGTFGLLKLRRR
ncbi:MAG: PEP-CTERM sorting domain-containing protein [Thermoguttaceae bacterium]|nr:PEP-CTERM sorting domain-containing protein [Thermoguttaceae bacterium]